MSHGLKSTLNLAKTKQKQKTKTKKQKKKHVSLWKAYVVVCPVSNTV